MISRKCEALKALESVHARLANPEPLDPLGRRLLLATIEHAHDEVAAIEELKRARRTTKAALPATQG